MRKHSYLKAVTKQNGVSCWLHKKTLSFAAQHIELPFPCKVYFNCVLHNGSTYEEKSRYVTVFAFLPEWYLAKNPLLGGPWRARTTRRWASLTEHRLSFPHSFESACFIPSVWKVSVVFLWFRASLLAFSESTNVLLLSNTYWYTWDLGFSVFCDIGEVERCCRETLNFCQ